MIGERIKTVKARLEKVKRQRGTQRKARERRGTFRVSLVGYTNAGKSTLFNAWSRPGPMRPTSCSPRWTPPRGRCGWKQGRARCRLSDTVGFIRDLPHKLVEAFEGHAAGSGRCRPAAARDRRRQPGAALEQQAEVERVLAEIGAARRAADLVFNKCDLLEHPAPRAACDWVEVHPGVRRRACSSARARAGPGCPCARPSANGAGALECGRRPHLTPPDGSVAVACHRHRAPARIAPSFLRTSMRDLIPPLHPAVRRARRVARRCWRAAWRRRPSPSPMAWSTTTATTARPTWTSCGATSTASSAACLAARAAARAGPKAVATARRRRALPARHEERRHRRRPDGPWWLLIWLGSGFFIVQEGQQAVVTTFGKYSRTVDAGFQWRCPTRSRRTRSWR
jgi:hypothetical protein